jgi:hypothetical protein
MVSAFREKRRLESAREQVVDENVWTSAGGRSKRLYKIANEGLHALNPRNITKIVKSTRARLPGLVARMGRDRKAYMMLVCKPEGKRSHQKHMQARGCNIKMG